MTLYFIYCLYSREIVFEKIYIRDFAIQAMILHTAWSLLVHKLRRFIEALRPKLTPYESWELDLFDYGCCITVIDLPSLCYETMETALSAFDDTCGTP